MARWFYTVIIYLITPLILLRLGYRASKAPAYRRRIAERFGLFTAEDVTDGIWIHSVSVGETIAAAPLVKRLQQQYPRVPIIVTTMTPTGSERVRALFGDSVFHIYAPYDLPGSIGRFLDRIRPRLLVIMETELWPNTIYYSRKRNIPVLLANARLSAKSAAGYRRLLPLTRPMLASLSKVVAQTPADGERFLGLGLCAAQLVVSGSIKFDIAISDELKAEARDLKALWTNAGQRLVILAASTHDREDEIVIEAFKRVLAECPRMLLVLVPRHPERFDRVAALSSQHGLITLRRSTAERVDNDTQVLIGDSMGELLLFYGCADICFVGGSLVDTGGHNTLEPAAWGVPIITGQSDYNFLHISRLLQDQNALFKVSNPATLAATVKELANSRDKRTAAGANALAVIEANRGALDRLVSVVDNYL